MSFDTILQRFTEQAPVATMVRAAMANILSPRELDAIFEDCRQRQYEDTLLFSSVVGLLSLAVTKVHGSLHAAYQAQRAELGVKVASLYLKISHTELPIIREFVRRTAQRMTAVIEAFDLARTPVLPGYRTFKLDGSHLAASEHRLKETRLVNGGPLPGQGLVVLDADLGLISDFLPCDDGHEQERAQMTEWVDLLQPTQLWIADRNFCTKLLIFECLQNQACFLVRHHAGLEVKVCDQKRQVGRCSTGTVWEQQVVVTGKGNEQAVLRRITIELDELTSEGERQLHLLTNLPAEISAACCADLYRTRWSIEAAFGELTLALHGEIDTLCYPKAALLGYAIALVTYNLLAVVKAAMKVVHGQETIDTQVSTYYLASEVSTAWHGMEIAVPPCEWERRYADLPPAKLADALVGMARHTNIRHYRKHKRGPKKPPPPRHGSSPHISTAKLLTNRQRQ
jgi:IS4 transposase